MTTKRRQQTIIEEALDEGEAPGMLRAILIDPRDCSASYVDLALLPATSWSNGGQLAPGRLAQLLGRRIEQVELTDEEALLVGSAGNSQPWFLGFEGPHRGPGLIVRYCAACDVYDDTALTPEKVADILTFEADEAAEADGAIAVA